MTDSVGARYLRKLDVPVPQAADLGALHQLLTAHERHIPFENITSYLGGVVSVDLDEVLTKLLDADRGGYCFEHSVLAENALRDLGFDVRRVGARVYRTWTPEQVHARTHQAAIVTVAGVDYLYDPGFGGSTPTVPIRLSGDRDIRDGFRAQPAAHLDMDPQLLPDISLMIEHDDPQHGWTPLYGLVDVPVVPSDTAAFNFYTSLSPESVFTRMLMIAGKGPDGSITLADRSAHRRTATGTERFDLDTSDDLARCLRAVGIEVDTSVIGALWDRLTQQTPRSEPSVARGGETT